MSPEKHLRLHPHCRNQESDLFKTSGFVETRSLTNRMTSLVILGQWILTIRITPSCIWIFGRNSGFPTKTELLELKDHRLSSKERY